MFTKRKIKKNEKKSLLLLSNNNVILCPARDVPREADSPILEREQYRITLGSDRKHFTLCEGFANRGSRSVMEARLLFLIK